MATPAFDIITIADMCVDLVVDLGDSVPRFGQVEQWVEDYFVELGGSANIFACQAARLGLRVAVLGRVGDDAFGRLALRRLGECGVDTRYVTVDAGLKTGIGVALCRSGGDRAILTYAGSISAVGPEDVTDDFLRSGRHLHYCSYYLQMRLLPHAPAVLHRARELGLSVSLDTNWDPEGRWQGGLREALSAANLFLPNEQEAIAIASALAAEPASSLDEAVSQLVALGPVIAVKQGERGALVANRESRGAVPVEPVARVIDTIGAGDCFDAGFVAAWLAGRPLAECAALGNACGRASTQARGGIRGQLVR
jgi:sugar/nucleoside kinase (ribokinase family)